MQGGVTFRKLIFLLLDKKTSRISSTKSSRDFFCKKFRDCQLLRLVSCKGNSIVGVAYYGILAWWTSWRILQLSSVSMNLHLWFDLILAIGNHVNFLHLWFLWGTINEEQSTSKTEKKIGHGNVPSQKRGVSQYIREDYGHNKEDMPDRQKIRRIFIKTLDFSVSIYILVMQSYINAFLRSWYVSNTYHSPVNFHINSTYFICSTPMY